MMPQYPRILSRYRRPVSSWVELVEKVVQFSPGSSPEVFHFVSQKAYVGILARTSDGLIPLVRQYRPCVEDYTWEFPAGTMEPGETPTQAAQRELLEETGSRATELLYLGNFYPDTGRSQIDSHAFFANVAAPQTKPGEEGLSVRYVQHQGLKQMILTGEFRHQLHLAIYAMILTRGISLD